MCIRLVYMKAHVLYIRERIAVEKAMENFILNALRERAMGFFLTGLYARRFYTSNM